MEITDIRFVRYDGTIPDVDPATFYEERLTWPLDVYDEFRPLGFEDTFLADTSDADYHPFEEDGALKTKQHFLEIHTDAGVVGLSGPIYRSWAYLINDMRDLLIGRDPLATEKLWDLMYRKEVHGRKGKTMQAISAVDCALWDLKGKHYGEPVYRLLGGPTRTELPAYASMLGYSVDPDRVRERAAAFKDEGFGAQKWFFRHGPGSGAEGKNKNVALVEAAREAVGDDYDLMFDCWMSWNQTYARDMFDRLAPFNPRWVEEPVHPDKIDQYAALKADAPFPIAGGEHEYTRWGIHELLRRDGLDVVQADTYWAGGISELQKICTLGSVHDVPVIPHGHSVPANVHVTAAQSPTASPLVEYLYTFNVGLQHFFEEPVRPENGVIEVPDRPGLGVTIDESKVEAATEITF